MTVPFETQRRYLNEIRRQAHGTVRCERIEERAVARLYHVFCGMWDVRLCRFLLDCLTQKMEASRYSETCVRPIDTEDLKPSALGLILI